MKILKNWEVLEIRDKLYFIKEISRRLDYRNDEPTEFILSVINEQVDDLLDRFN